MAVKKNKTAIKNQNKHLLGIQNLSILEAKNILDCFILIKGTKK